MNQSDSVKTFEQLLEEDFHKMADELTIVRGYGTMHGVVDVTKTEMLKQAFAMKDGMVSWQETYKLRKQLQQGHYLEEQRKRDGL